MGDAPPGGGPAKTTPLRAQHEALGARFTPFAGFEMPLQYEGILAEHRAVREACGVFDVSHMSDLDVPLEDAEALASALGADVTQLPEGASKYTVLLHEDGTILDDLIVTRLPDRFHLVANAGMNEAVTEVLHAHGCLVGDLTFELCILAVQGPEARAVIEQAVGVDAWAPRFQARPLHGGPGFTSGTGYTGEPGVELVLPIDEAEATLEDLIKAGATPCGLGARDTLRLEQGYALAGNEFDPPVTPVEARLLWTLDLDHPFRGRDAVLARKEAGARQVLTGIRLTERGIPRRGCTVLLGEEEVGTVSSGTMSPSLGEGIALAYLTPAASAPDTNVAVDVGGLAGIVTRPPFIRSSATTT